VVVSGACAELSGGSDVAASLRSGEVTPVDLVQAALDRADEVAHLGVFERLDAEGALAQAERALQELTDGRDRGPLHGVPIAVKDVLAVAGLPRTGSSRALGTEPVVADSAAVAALRRAGAVVLGTTRTHELAFGFTTPGTRNPHDPARIPGGSSGGSAAAVAAGICRVALGTDTAGSVRNPASLCGVVGLKPTYGLADRGGMLPLSWSMDHVGILAASTAEARAVLAALAPDEGPGPASGGQPGPLRIGVPAPRGRIDEGVLDVTVQAMARLERSGATLVEVEFPWAEHALAAGFAIILTEAAARHGHLVRERREQLTDEVAMLLAAGQLLPAVTYAQAQRVRNLIATGWRDTFERHRLDLVAAPTLPITAPLVGAETVTWSDGAVEPLVPVVAGATIAQDLTGLPAISVPCGAVGGLPVGLTLTGRPFADRAVLDAAELLETSTAA
jgi:aspartyl-tRNA(Asn)/glutamyl-tRNA(Gln) amidotransferase subunit A